MKERTPRKLIIDTDPGIDDAVAILACFRAQSDVDILGLTTVAGNKGIAYTTNNASRLLEYLQAPCLAYKGSQTPLQPSIFIEEKNGEESATGSIHGAEGLGSAQLPLNPDKISPQNAVDFILEQVRTYPGAVDILALGPLTNLAQAIQKDKETMKKVRSIFSMGGGVHRGNVTPVAEFNYWFDPDAVQIVFEELGPHIPIYMIGLDLTHQLRMSHEDLFFMRAEGGKDGELIYQMLEHYARVYWDEQKILGMVIHDLTAALCYLDPSLMTETHFIHMDCQTGDGPARGQCVCDLLGNWKQEANCHVVLQVEHKRYKEAMIQTLFGENCRKCYSKFLLEERR